MTFRIPFIVLALAGFALCATAQTPQPKGAGFVANNGRLLGTNGNPAPSVLYTTSAAQSKVYIEATRNNFVWSQQNTDQSHTLYRMAVEFTGCNPAPVVSPTENTGRFENYFLGHTPAGVTNLPVWNKLTWAALYPGIDLDLTTTQPGLLYALQGLAGSDPAAVRLTFQAASSVSIDGDKTLIVQTPLGGLRFTRPILYRIENNGKETAFTLAWKQTSNSVTIDVDRTLVQNNKFRLEFAAIPVTGGNVPQPFPGLEAVEQWCTYFGGSNLVPDIINETRTDAAGNIYVAGLTYSSEASFPVVNGAYLAYFGNGDAFVAKFNPDRGRDWVTYFGGSGADEAMSIAVTDAGTVLVAGTTRSGDLPTVDAGGSGYYDDVLDGNYDGFVLQLSANGFTNQWSTYLGGDSDDFLNFVAVKGNKVVVGGTTTSDTDLPLTAVSGSWNQGGTAGFYDGFLAQFDAAATLTWCSHVGGWGHDFIEDGSFDANGNLFITGTSTSAGATTCAPGGDFPLCNASGSAFSEGNHGAKDVFVAKFDPAHVLQWSTMYGGSGDETQTFYLSPYKTRLLVDLNNHVYIGAGTASNDVATQAPAAGALNLYHQPTYGGGATDGLLLKFTNAGVREWATYFGGSGRDAIGGLAVGSGTEAYRHNALFVAGSTTSDAATFPLMHLPGGYEQMSLGSTNGDAFIGWFTAAGTQLLTTYFGGDNADEGRCAAYDPQAETLIITGHTASQQTTFPLLDIPGTADYFDGTYNGGDGDGFLGELILDCNACLQNKLEDEPLTEATETGALRVWPNPTTGYVMIEQAEAKELTATVCNLTGQTVLSQRMTDTANRLDLTSLPKGVYVLKLTSEASTVKRKLVLH